MNDEVKINLMSLDIFNEKISLVKQLFPEVFVEGKIDFERLKQILSENIEAGKERYGMTWAGKSNCFKIIQEPSGGTFKISKTESVSFETTSNIFIEGDNLEALKLLQKAYYDKVKVIYIDPPYNTGKEFIYPDNFSESLDTYLKYTGQKDSEGKKFSTNLESDGRYHSKWLNMMYPRLYLARNLLTDEGLIFISIDDHEVNNLRKLLDEVFGEENFLAQFIWKSRQSEDTRATTGASTDHEYILCYRKSDEAKLRGSEKDLDKFSNPDNDPRGPWRSADLTGLATRDRRPNLHYDLINPATAKNYGCPPKGWRYEPTTMTKKISEGRVLWPATQDGRPRHKLFLNEMQSLYKNISSVISDVITSDGTKEINKIMGDGVFDFPKPSKLIKLFLEQTLSDGEIVLDFFAGSASTAQAVLDLNQQDGKNRKFIVIQLPEPCAGDSPAYKAGFLTIADIGKERIRRAIAKIQADCPQSEIDLGYKCLKLTTSNFKVWEAASEQEIEPNLLLFTDHVQPGSTQEDILAEILIKSGFELDTKIEKLLINEMDVFSVEEGAMFVYLGNLVTKELTYAIAEKSPSRFICLDHSFNQSDKLKTNTVQLMKSRNIEFRTV